MKKLFLLLLPTLGFSAGPVYQHKDDLDQQEFVNVYHDIQYPIISAGKATAFSATTLSVSTITAVSSATITNLTVTNLVGQKVQQILGFCTAATSSNSSTTYGNSDVVLSITPRANTDAVLVLVSANGADNTGAFQTYLTLARGGTDLLSGNGGVGFARTVFAGTNANNMNGSFVYVDSPASASALSYSVQFKTSNASGTARSNSQGHTQCIVLVDYVP